MCLPVAVQRDATPKALCIHTPPSANHVKISNRSANQAGFGSKGGENVPRMPVSRQKCRVTFGPRRVTFGPLPGPCEGGAVRVKNKIPPKSAKNQLWGPLRKPPAQWRSVSGRNGQMAHACALPHLGWFVPGLRHLSPFWQAERQPLQNSQQECKPSWIYTQRCSKIPQIDQQPAWARGSTVSATCCE